MDLPGYDAWKLATPPEYERDEAKEDEAPAAGSPEEPQPPCPHARPSWRLCPWCLSINLPVDPDVTW